ncbi:Transcriptional repressor ILP1 [Cucurbita argyrosperma subsp. argyrosperma]|uniref:Transcriptional repressor ILP1 n=1 Tax=Cucurbita moschata TaxID=3662 RepID=A0A6J1G0Q4_CUCMO|nr:transcriptional repressor ILP1 [Cucurbita moschata]KAG7013053.1 Transcriptional repressor ILP1 [Cucurbita argyrosperma subsp. argyrosperma]
MSGSRARNFRRRADDNDDDDEPNGAAAPSTGVSNASSKAASTSSTVANKPKKANPQVPKLLSFASDEENDAPLRTSSKPANSKKPSSARLAKPSSTHKITALKDRIAHSSSTSASVPSNVQPQAGTYTKEALRELQKNTRTLASSRSSSESKPSAEPVIVLKGLLKPVEQISDSAKEGKESSSEDEEGGSNEKSAGSFRRSKEDALARMASMGIGRGKDSTGSIPDQATINAIRAKRERMRQAGVAAPDYISLDAGSNRTAPGELSDEETEFPGRIAMIGGKSASSKKGVFEEFDEQAIDGVRTNIIEHSDEDEEEKIWEAEQFRKGLGKRMDDGSTRVESSSVPLIPSVPQQNLIYPTTAGYNSVPSISTATSIGGSVGVSQGLDGLSISQQAEIAKKAMRDNMGRLKESYRRTAASVLKTDENLSASLLNITALEKSLSAAGEKFIFMQKLRDFVSVICDFLQHKAPFIEELEEQMQKLHEERASTVVERRVADNDDEMVEIEAAVKAAMSILNKKGSSNEMIAAATSAAQAAIASAKEQANLPTKVDEFGRDLNLQKRMDMKRRAEARKRRRAKYDSKRLASTEVDGHQKVEGESSTDESDSEAAAYQSNHDLLLQTADQIFSDAAEEFSQLSVVKQRFEQWKRDYSATYRDAYMSLSTAAIFSPYVRLELLKWDPLHENADFFDMNWHSLLFNYGMPEDGSDFAPNDADANLVPELVEKVALPILHHEVAHCWDMLSTRETRNAAFATSLITNYVPTSSEALTELLVVIRTRLSSAVEDLTVPTWSALVMKAVPNAARIAAYRFGISVRLMRNICLWKEIIALPILEKLALEELLYGKVLPHVRSITANIHDAVTRTERIIASLSGVWTGPGVTGDRSHKLQPLVDYVMLLGRTLEKKHISGIAESETSGLARRLKKMLVELNEYDNARDIAKTFHLREAL